ncbi:hypothetical protein T05_11852 [Trichinella murrelli]|uniref:Uncharacterized protein n=1 Tax=Trichinella murrelli TaxID=144512 RepID=A0A0V0TWD3_9BILA|nr:hypothetical protein T05_11852 [Trichinella murrelli]
MSAKDVDAGRCFNQIYGFSSTLEQWRFSNHIRIGISNPVRFPQTVVRSTAALKKPQGLPRFQASIDFPLPCQWMR